MAKKKASKAKKVTKKPLKAMPHQQQPPNPGACAACGSEFNNKKRRRQHVYDTQVCHDYYYENNRLGELRYKD